MGVVVSAGYFGVAIFRPKFEVNVGGLWRSALSYDARFLATVGHRYKPQASDTCKAPNAVPLHHYDDIDDLVEHLPKGCPLVGVELDERAEPLDKFQHPDRALYLLGAEDHGLPPAVLDRCHWVIQIESSAPWSLNVASAGTVVLRDRFLKRRRADAA
ncbi:RNA methyltransferase [Nocardia asiatica]